MAGDALDIRMAHLEGAYEQIDRRLGSLDGRMASLERKVDAMRSELLARMDRQFFWTLSLLFISILSPIALRLAGH